MTTAQTYLKLITRPGSGPSRLEMPGGQSGDTADKQELLERLRAEIGYVERKTNVTVDADAIDTLMRKPPTG